MLVHRTIVYYPVQSSPEVQYNNAAHEMNGTGHGE